MKAVNRPESPSKLNPVPFSPSRQWFTALLPFLRWWPRVNRSSLRADAIAGLVGAIVVLPQGVAFATLAGLPPQYGLYAAMVPAVIAALFGSSWHLVSGPTNVISIFIFASMSPLAEPGSAEYIRLVLTLTFLAGVIQLAMGLARMGALVNFISHIDFKYIRSVFKTSRQEIVVMAATFSAALFANLEFAIYAGVLLSLLLYLTRTSRPLVIDVKPDPAQTSYHYSADTGLPDCPQLKMVRINGSIFFGAADHIQGRLEEIAATQAGRNG